MSNTELETKNKCIETIIKTCKIHFGKLKEIIYIQRQPKPIEVVVLHIHGNQDVIFITESGVIAKGSPNFDNTFKTKPLKMTDLSMEQIYECLKELVRRTC